MNRFSDDSGWSMTGALATFGSACDCVSRSATTWRALSMSVPGSKVMTIDDRPASDFDSIFSRKATPWRRSASSGTVTSSSTSSADRPSASVWTSTVVGANSGSTSTRADCSWVAPTSRSTPAMPMHDQSEPDARADEGTHHGNDPPPTPRADQLVTPPLSGASGASQSPATPSESPDSGRRMMVTATTTPAYTQLQPIGGLRDDHRRVPPGTIG